ncbi:MAG: acyl-CoA dehydrogenase family protein [Alphaproteobacteria bacterium]|nr:acyl-CoA dehydrogenase family protein [Alphaproteobacteria bacterium]MCB9928071.1 acyl-CoA dehydrogenase family protein [Alphaproteobacteria bacterium]
MASASFRDFETYLTAIERFTDEELIPAEPRLEAEDCVPEPLVERMRELGLFGISIPEEYGGLACNQEEQVRLTMAFTRASAVFRSRFSTTIGLTSQAILDFATEDQKREWLPRMASGAVTGAFALTEPDAGSDAGGLKTTAVRDGDDYVLNGRKRYITNAPEADLFLVMARTDPASTGSAGVSAFLVPAGTPGIEALPAPPLLGLRGSHSTEMNIENCRVPAANLVGHVEGRGLGAALRGINSARTHVAATCVGQAIRLIAEAVAHARKREQFGQPIGEFQMVQAMLAEMQADMLAAKALVLDVARAFDRAVEAGTPLPFPDIAAAKYFGSEMVCRVADRAVQILGGAGYIEDNAITRLYRDVRLFRLFEGTSQMQQQQIAKAMLRAG